MRVLAVFAGVLLVGALFAGAALATGPVVAQAPSARLAVLIDGGDGPAPNFVILRQKGVLSVTNPQLGVFCIKPSNTKVNVLKIVPNVSTEFGLSNANDDTAQWNSTPLECPSGTIEVLTFHVNNAHENNVGFTVTVF